MGVTKPVEQEHGNGASGLERVYLMHRDTLLRFLRARGAGDAAEDLLQELWIKAAAAASGPVRDPLPYLYRVANNLMLDRRRSELRQAKREQAWSAPDDLSPELPDPAPPADRTLMAREELEALQQTLQAAGERSVYIFRRFRLEGATQREIAAEIGISLSAVEKHLQKIYQLLVQFRRRGDAG